MLQPVPVIRTRRLDLLAATLESCAAEVLGHVALAHFLNAGIPSSWPPPVFEPDDVARIREQLTGHADAAAWTLHYLLAREALPTRDLVGVAGYAGPPTLNGILEIGYAIAVEHQGRGYATETVHCLVARAFADPRVHTIRAHTYPALEQSIGVLRKAGFELTSTVSDAGLLRYERKREPGAG
jgi:ribosomal-protein-alanine N-acetyltransferase